MNREGVWGDPERVRVSRRPGLIAEAVVDVMVDAASSPSTPPPFLRPYCGAPAMTAGRVKASAIHVVVAKLPWRRENPKREMEKQFLRC